MFKRIDHVALEVADIDLPIDFYETSFVCKHYYKHKPVSVPGSPI